MMGRRIRDNAATYYVGVRETTRLVRFTHPTIVDEVNTLGCCGDDKIASTNP
jgi:hypothetical protein